MKNILFILLWVTYLLYFFISQESSIFKIFFQHIEYGEIFLSYINAFIAYFTTLWAIGICNNYLQKFFENLKTHKDTEFREVFWSLLIKFIGIIKYIAALYALFSFAYTPEYINAWVDKISSILVLIILLFFLTSFINTIFEKELLFKSKLKAVSRNLLPVINKVIIIFIWIVGIITIIWNLWYNVSALVAGAGIGWLAVALAAQKSLTNVFWAITILLNKPFKIGDYISINWQIGTVKDIGLSYLTMIHQQGHQVMIPNEMIITTFIENFSVRDNRRTDFSIGLVYGTSLEQMKKAVEIIENILAKYVEENTISNFRVNFDMFWDFSLNINATYFSLINDPIAEYYKQKEQINLQIKQQFADADLSMAFPTRELIIKKEL